MRIEFFLLGFICESEWIPVKNIFKGHLSILIRYQISELNSETSTAGFLSVKKDVRNNLAKLSGTHLCQSFFFNKVADLRFSSYRPPNFIKRETLTQVFSCEFYEFSKNTFFTEHLWTIASEGSIQRCILNPVKYLRCIVLWK